MREEISRIPRVVVTRSNQKIHTLTWLGIVILILDIAFLFWGGIRILLIAFPRLQVGLVEIIFKTLALTREGELDRIYEAIQRFFFLPVSDRFNTLGDVVINTFLTVLVFVVGFALYRALDLIGKHLVKPSINNS